MRINQMLDDNKSYRFISEALAAHGVVLNADNLSKYYNQQYQEYLAAQDREAVARALQQSAQDGTGAKLQEGVVQLGLTQLFRGLYHNNPAQDPLHSIRLFNATARLSREALLLRQLRDRHDKLSFPKTNAPDAPCEQE
jgi:hypothetical protein